VFLEHELRELFRDVDGDGLNGSRIDVEAHEKDAPSVDHGRQNGALKRKLWNVQVDSGRGSKRIPMIRSEKRRRASGVNYEAGSIWG
jgi:hypothetical protein